MIYLDSGATSFPKPPGVVRAMETALEALPPEQPVILLQVI